MAAIKSKRNSGALEIHWLIKTGGREKTWMNNNFNETFFSRFTIIDISGMNELLLLLLLIIIIL